MRSDPVPQSRALRILALAALAGFVVGGVFGGLGGTGGAEPAPPPPAAAPAQPVPAAGTLTRFNGAHLEQRVRLANSLTSAEQERAATKLAGEFALTARTLDRRGAPAETVAALDRLAEAYDRLASAAHLRYADAFAEASREIRAHERRLRSLLRAPTAR